MSAASRFSDLSAAIYATWATTYLRRPLSILHGYASAWACSWVSHTVRCSANLKELAWISMPACFRQGIARAPLPKSFTPGLEDPSASLAIWCAAFQRIQSHAHDAGIDSK